MAVYLDLVFLLNFLVDWMLLLGTNRLAGYPLSWGRTALAAAAGGLYGISCLLPGFSFLGSFLWRGVSLVLMGGTAFGWHSGSLRRIGIFVLLSLAMGGLAEAVGRGDLVLLVAEAAGLWALCGVLFRNDCAASYIPVRLCCGGRTVSLTALRDTGNTLRDPVTGEQVLVAGADVAGELLGLTSRQLRDPIGTVASGRYAGLRLIPYRSVGQPGGMLLAVRMEESTVGGKKMRPLVAFAPEDLGGGGAYRMLTGGVIS